MEVFNGFLQEHFDKIHGYDVYSYYAVYIMFILCLFILPFKFSCSHSESMHG